ncbi:putative integrase core domain containing protein [Lyophyllum shimeji]|uniref:Integrase core domain containing protein n=1 Tax=Lyophyllum shimeji TaxID=47721 RepID=A0A9P3PZI3_LYOSH|nr:putative integrase core domain containing protein [Lyophyllum shimeji]
MLDTGRNPHMGFEPRPLNSTNETANEFFERMKLAQEEAKAALAKAKDDMARYYDQRRIPAPEYKPGDRVYLDASDIQTTHPSKKLSHRYLGPYTIECQVGSLAYKLRLPRSMSHLHPVFNAVKLRLAPPDPIPGRRTRPPPPPTLIDNEEWFDVEDILDSRFFRRKLQYKVKWKGYGYEDASWERVENVARPRPGPQVPSPTSRGPQASPRDVLCGPGDPPSRAHSGASGCCTLEGGDMYSTPAGPAGTPRTSNSADRSPDPPRLPRPCRTPGLG